MSYERHKKFGKRVFRMLAGGLSQHEAQKRAKEYRSKGRLARVIEQYDDRGTMGYVVWVY